jgi:3-oxoacyl-[acyl-carrier-protein] synthase II
VPVTALKGYLGNLVSGCGAVELIASLHAVSRGKIPPILNCEQPDPECELDLVLKAPRATRNPTFVKTNVTPLGQAAALVLRSWPSPTASPEDN